MVSQDHRLISSRGGLAGTGPRKRRGNAAYYLRLRGLAAFATPDPGGDGWRVYRWTPDTPGSPDGEYVDIGIRYAGPRQARDVARTIREGAK